MGESNLEETRHELLREAELAKIATKVEVLHHNDNWSSITYVLNDEDHSLGNALRYIIMKNPNVEFCGYSAPHPSESKIHLRIQMYGGQSALNALSKGLDDLKDMVEHIRDTYDQDLKKEDYKVFVEPELDMSQFEPAAAEYRRAQQEKRQQVGR